MIRVQISIPPFLIFLQTDYQIFRRAVLASLGTLRKRRVFGSFSIEPCSMSDAFCNAKCTSKNIRQVGLVFTSLQSRQYSTDLSIAKKTSRAYLQANAKNNRPTLQVRRIFRKPENRRQKQTKETQYCALCPGVLVEKVGPRQ